MSKKHVVSETGTEADGGTDTGSDDGGAERVDLGIGIAVDIDVDAAAEGEDVVELTYDEDDHLEDDEDAVGAPTVGAPELEADERAALETAAVDPDAIREKEYSYRMLLDAGVDESVADALRRRFSLPWSFESDGDLDRRSSEVRGLGDAEREWIAVSGDEDWQSFEYEESPVAAVAREKPSERPWPKPTPVTAVTGVGPDDAEKLAAAGVCSAERLATISAFDVARALDLDVLHVRTWRHNARELLA